MKKSTKSTNKETLPSMFGTKDTRGYLANNPVSETMIDWLCEKLLEYAGSPDATFIGCFIRDMRIPRKTFYNWLEMYPKLKATYSDAKSYIGYNRMDGALKKKYDFKTVLHTQYRFGQEWDEDDKRQVELHKKDETNLIASNFKVVMQPDEDDPSVKEKE